MIREIPRTLACAIMLLCGPALQASAAGWAINEMQDWAVSVEELIRGPLDVADPGLGNASYGNPLNVVGPALGDVNTTVSLGDGGSVTLLFDPAIGDGPSDDFAVFENAFFSTEGLFAEFAFVEVSSNGIDFARLPSLTTNPDPVPSFGSVFPTDYVNFAGDEAVGLGTGFDLRTLWTDPLVTSGFVDLQDIAFVRIVDVIGNGATLDDDGNPVWDPYPTPFLTGGFDLDGVGVRNVPEPARPAGLALGFLGLLGLRRMRRSRPFAALAGLLLVAALPAATAEASQLVDFEDIGLAPSSFYDGADLAGQFDSRGVTFENVNIPAWRYWYGFAASTMTDATTPGFGNQYSAISGGGASGSATYGLFFDDAAEDPRMVLGSPSALEGVYLTNTAYAYYSMLLGDAFAKQFGGASGDDPDWLKLSVTGYDAAGAAVPNAVEFYLADFRPTDNALDYIISEWTWLDLSALGTVKSLGFALSSSDVDPDFGFINTPVYFALDDLQIVPEPGTALLLGVGLLGLGLRRRA